MKRFADRGLFTGSSEEKRMPWIRISGLPGKVYVPEDDGQSPKKHPCITCHACQWCDENRCRVCRGGDETANHKSQAPASK